MLIRRIARPLLSVAFIGQGVNSLLNPKTAAAAAAPAVDGLQALPNSVSGNIPSDPETFAQINAGVQIGGGLLLAIGKFPRFASAALAVTVLPANLGAHSFWNESDPQAKAQKRQQFLTDLSLVGGLLIASADTAGKPSLGWRGRRAAERLSERVSSALPGSDDAGFERGRQLASTAAERGAPYAEAALERGREFANTAAERSKPLANKARKRGEELADEAVERATPLARKARKRGEELADEAADWAAPLAKKARKRSEKLAKKARKRGEELANTVLDRGEDLADTARARGSYLADTARARGGYLADTARDRLNEQVKTGRRKLS
jgi:uncharacterized membrane protein YphA (DoxX/SURF4 family)